MRLTSAVLLLLAPAAARADGMKFMTDGRMVPEREQRALIEWENGTETLHVAALGDPTAEGTVWVVPVKAAAKDVRAEPVDRFPAVVYYETLKKRAERQLRNAVELAAVLDSGGCLLPLVLTGCGGGAPKAAVEESRVEKLGMVVVVLSAESRAALEEYLDRQGVNRAAVDLSPLDPYFGQPDFAFVCGWVAKRGELVTATALTVVFPSPTLWFPLRPTRAYTNPVETVVYVRGFVKPAPGCDLPDLHCQYIYGDVKELGVGKAFAGNSESLPRGYYPGPLERLTRVTLTTDPQKWDRDLELVPGTTAAGTVALAVTGWAGFYGPLWSALLGAMLGLFIPWISVSKAERRRIDWIIGPLIGAAIVLTVWASLLAFAAWRHHRFGDRPRRPSRWLVLPALAAAHLGVVYLVCTGLSAWINAAG
jgi:hypothetical protein